MNQFYEIVQSIINQGSPQALNNLINKINENPGNIQQDLMCGENVVYALKRLCGAALARDLRIKSNAEKALTELKAKVTGLSTLKASAFADYFLTATDMKDCNNRQQKNSYIQGKIIIVKALSQNIKGEEKIINHLVTLANNTESFQEELIEVLFNLTGQKFSTLKLKPTSPNAKYLIQVFTKKVVSESEIETILTNAIQEYPKESITLKHLGLTFSQIVTSPQQFFKSHYAEFTNISQQETEDGDLKKLYYLLQIQKYFFSNTEINQQNISKFLCVEMIIVWLQELRVKNKHMKRLANSITIKFAQDAGFSLSVLKYLHEQKIYLQNISVNHPFAALYKNVEPTQFWTYIIGLITKQVANQQITEQEDEQAKSKKEEYLSELQFITRQNVDVLTPQQIGETLTMLIKAFQASKRSQKLLNLVWSLFHKILERSEKKVTKKKIVLNTRGSLILSKIKLTELQLESEIIQILTKAIKFIRAKVKAHKDSEDKVVMSFLNFVTGLIVYCIVYPEEADVCAEIEFIFKDLQALIAKQSGVEQDVLKKKRKKSQQVAEDPRKAVHVMIEVFISLLTKAPIFLRNSINLVFEQFVPFIETSDLDTLLDVIQKPDQDYIEEI